SASTARPPPIAEQLGDRVQPSVICFFRRHGVRRLLSRRACPPTAAGAHTVPLCQILGFVEVVADPVACAQSVDPLLAGLPRLGDLAESEEVALELAAGIGDFDHPRGLVSSVPQCVPDTARTKNAAAGRRDELLVADKETQLTFHYIADLILGSVGVWRH